MSSARSPGPQDAASDSLPQRVNARSRWIAAEMTVSDEVGRAMRYSPRAAATTGAS
jgi:hypothetical protein